MISRSNIADGWSRRDLSVKRRDIPEVIDKKGCTEFEQNVADGGAYSWPDDRSTPGQRGNSIVAVELSSVLYTGGEAFSV